MAKKLTLKKLTEEIIRESQGFFTINDFSKNLESRWEKQISESALKKVRRILLNHHYLIGINENDFVSNRLCGKFKVGCTLHECTYTFAFVYAFQ